MKVCDDHRGQMEIGIIQGKRLEQMDSLKLLGNVIKSDGSCIEKIKSTVSNSKIHFSKVRNLQTAGYQLMFLLLSVVLYHAEMQSSREREINTLKLLRCGVEKNVEI